MHLPEGPGPFLVLLGTLLNKSGVGGTLTSFFVFWCMFWVPLRFQLDITFFDGKNMFFGFLDAKPSRITWKLPQKVSCGTEMYEIGPKVGTWTCPSCPKSHKSVIPHHGYNFFLVPSGSRVRPGQEGHEGLARPSRARPGGRSPSGPGHSARPRGRSPSRPYTMGHQ